MPKIVVTFLAALLCCLSAPRPAAACSCAPPPPPKEAMEKAKAVFAGKVTGVVDRDGRKTVTLDVSRSWKGAGVKKVVVTTASSGAACGYGFSTKGDAEYLVYAFDDGAGGLSTNICTRTKPLAGAEEDLKELGPAEAVD